MTEKPRAPYALLGLVLLLGACLGVFLGVHLGGQPKPPPTEGQGESALRERASSPSAKPPPLPESGESARDPSSSLDRGMPSGPTESPRPRKGTRLITLTEKDDWFFRDLAEEIIPTLNQVRTLVDYGRQDYIREQARVRVEALSEILGDQWNSAIEVELRTFAEEWAGKKWDNHQSYVREVNSLVGPSMSRDAIFRTYPEATKDRFRELSRQWLTEDARLEIQARLFGEGKLTGFLSDEDRGRYGHLVVRLTKYGEVGPPLGWTAKSKKDSSEESR